MITFGAAKISEIGILFMGDITRRSQDRFKPAGTGYRPTGLGDTEALWIDKTKHGIKQNQDDLGRGENDPHELFIVDVDPAVVVGIGAGYACGSVMLPDERSFKHQHTVGRPQSMS